MTNWFELGIQKYWAPTASVSKDVKQNKLEQAIESGNYLWSEKFDGNFLRGVITSTRNALQTRGISVVTNTYGEVQDKVFFWDDVVKAFPNGDTVLLGEGYIPGGIDSTVGSILRSLPPKALTRQKDTPVEWRIFDVLALDGESFLKKPIEERVIHIDEVVKRINNPLVKAVGFHPMDENFFNDLANIFARGGEGVVCYKKGVLYTPDKRSSAWTTIKVKQEIENEIDCIITGIEPPIRDYTGKYIGEWMYWEDVRTGEKLNGPYFQNFQQGNTVRPITKGYYYNLPGAIYVSVYNKNNELVPLCKVSGLTDEFKYELRDNFSEWKGCPVTIGGMMVSTAQVYEKDGELYGLSIRHPYLKAIRKGDIDPKDCTLSKILS